MMEYVFYGLMILSGILFALSLMGMMSANDENFHFTVFLSIGLAILFCLASIASKIYGSG